MNYESRIEKAVEFLSARDFPKPRWGVVLGSGLGDRVSGIQTEWSILTRDVPGWPISTVPGHEGRLIFGYHGSCPVTILQGRVHLYEGYSAQEVGLPVRILHRLGIQRLVLTNAAGGLNPDFRPGDVMIIQDHINLMAANPLIGTSPAFTARRFPDMSQVYDPGLIRLAEAAAGEAKIRFQTGVLLATMGPSYETPAEVRMMRQLGGDAVCMSTVPEAITGSQLGLRILGLSCITNPAAGLMERPLSHDDVRKSARTMGDSVHRILWRVIEES